MMNKRGQIDYPILTFIILIFGLLIIAPIVLKIFTTTQSSFTTAFASMNASGGQVASANFNAVMSPAINFWDKVIVASFFLSLLLLFVSAFLIDTNPLWVILYIFISFFMVIFAPNIIGALENIYGSATFGAEVARLTFMDWVRVHFAEVLIGVIVITGIIIYGKIWLFPRQQESRR